MIEVSNVNYSIGEERIIDNCSFTAAPGEIVALLGANGSGKTTLLRLLSGFMPPSSGFISLCDRWPSLKDREFRERVAALIGTPPNARDLKMREHSMLIAATWGLKLSECREKADSLFRKLDIEHLGQRYPHELSSGQKQLCGIALTLSRSFNVLLIDEPEQRLDDSYLRIVASILRENAESGVTVCMTTHNQYFIDSLADKKVHLGVTE